MKQRTLKTYTFQYRDGEITYNREDGYSAFFPAGNRLGGADSKVEAEALIDDARLNRTLNLMAALDSRMAKGVA